jgi:RNA polymerase Rpb1, domain 5/RNA polymerase Rpb1, domain 4
MITNKISLNVQTHALQKSQMETVCTKLIYFNRSFDKSRLKNLINWSLTHFGEKKTIDLIELFKTLGYRYATKAGISLSIEDLKIPISKNQLLVDAETKLKLTNQDVKKGYLTSIEYFAQVIDTWNTTSELIKNEVIDNFKKTDVLNPVYMMSFSGARGNISQVRQLVGMRGLMADPSGRIIDFPIQSNFREGLTLTEYIISCYGARKGVVDTALRTATSGYLTRRLVDVAQHVIVRIYDCQTQRGIYVSDLKMGTKTLLSSKNRLIGRVLAETIYLQSSKKVLAYKNQEITPKLAQFLIQNQQPSLIRSPLTCQDKNYVCQLCYGWNLSHNRLVPLGEAIGIIAAQSIGEPGTQLTMRTFHTGGVFSGDVSEQIRAPFSGFICFSNSIAGKLVRTTHGQIAFLTKQDSFLTITTIPDLGFNKPKSKALTKWHQKPLNEKLIIPAYSLLFVKQNQKVKAFQLLAEASSFLKNNNQSIEVFQTIYSESAGEVHFKQSTGVSVIKQDESEQEQQDELQLNIINLNMGEFWILSAQKQTVLKPIHVFVKTGDCVKLDSFIYHYYVFNSLNLTFQNPALDTCFSLTGPPHVGQTAITPYTHGKHDVAELLYTQKQPYGQANPYGQTISQHKQQTAHGFQSLPLTFAPGFFNQLSKQTFPLTKSLFFNQTRFKKSNYFFTHKVHRFQNPFCREQKDFFICETPSKNSLNVYQTQLQKISFDTNNFQSYSNMTKKTYFLNPFKVQNASYGLTQTISFKQALNEKMIVFENRFYYDFVPLNYRIVNQKQSGFKKPIRFKLPALTYVHNKRCLKKTGSRKQLSGTSVCFGFLKNIANRWSKGFVNHSVALFNKQCALRAEARQACSAKVAPYASSPAANDKSNKAWAGGKVGQQSLSQKRFLLLYISQLNNAYDYYFRFQKFLSSSTVTNTTSPIFFTKNLKQTTSCFFYQFHMQDAHLIKQDQSFFSSLAFNSFIPVLFHKKNRLMVFSKNNKFPIKYDNKTKNNLIGFVRSTKYSIQLPRKKKIRLNKTVVLRLLNCFLFSNSTYSSKALSQYNLFIWNVVFEKTLQIFFLWFSVLKKLNQNQKNHFICFESKSKRPNVYELCYFSFCQKKPLFYFLDKKKHRCFSFCSIWLYQKSLNTISLASFGNPAVNRTNPIQWLFHLQNRHQSKLIDHQVSSLLLNGLEKSTFFKPKKAAYWFTPKPKRSKFSKQNSNQWKHKKRGLLQKNQSRKEDSNLSINFYNSIKNTIALNKPFAFVTKKQLSVKPFFYFTQLNLFLKPYFNFYSPILFKKTFNDKNHVYFNASTHLRVNPKKQNMAFGFVFDYAYLAFLSGFFKMRNLNFAKTKFLFYFSSLNQTELNKQLFNHYFYQTKALLKKVVLKTQKNTNGGTKKDVTVLQTKKGYAFQKIKKGQLNFTDFLLQNKNHPFKKLFETRWQYQLMANVELKSNFFNGVSKNVFVQSYLKTAKQRINFFKINSTVHLNTLLQNKISVSMINYLLIDHYFKTYPFAFCFLLEKFTLSLVQNQRNLRNLALTDCNLIKATKPFYGGFDNDLISNQHWFFLLPHTSNLVTNNNKVLLAGHPIGKSVLFETYHTLNSVALPFKKTLFFHMSDLWIFGLKNLVNKKLILFVNKKQFKPFFISSTSSFIYFHPLILNQKALISINQEITKKYLNLNDSLNANKKINSVIKRLNQKAVFDFDLKENRNNPMFLLFFDFYFRSIYITKNQKNSDLRFKDMQNKSNFKRSLSIIQTYVRFSLLKTARLPKKPMLNDKRILTKFNRFKLTDLQKQSLVFNLKLTKTVNRPFFIKTENVFLNLGTRYQPKLLIDQIQYEEKLNSHQVYDHLSLLRSQKQQRLIHQTSIFNACWLKIFYIAYDFVISQKSQEIHLKNGLVPNSLLKAGCTLGYPPGFAGSSTFAPFESLTFAPFESSTFALSDIKQAVSATFALRANARDDARGRAKVHISLSNVRSQILEARFVHPHKLPTTASALQVTLSDKNVKKKNLNFLTFHKQLVPTLNFSMVQSKSFQLQTIDIIKSQLTLLNSQKGNKLLSFYPKQKTVFSKDKKRRVIKLNTYWSILSFNLFERHKRFTILSLPAYSKSFYFTKQHFFFLNRFNYLFHLHVYETMTKQCMHDFYFKTNKQTPIFKIYAYSFKRGCLENKIKLLSMKYVNDQQKQGMFNLFPSVSNSFAADKGNLNMASVSATLQEKNTTRKTFRNSLLKKALSLVNGEVLSIQRSNDSNKLMTLNDLKKQFKTIYYLTDRDIITYVVKSNLLPTYYLGDFLNAGKQITNQLAIDQPGQLLFISDEKIILRKANVYLLASGAICNLKPGSFVNLQTPLLTLTYKNIKTEDIVQGIPRIEQIFEAREKLTEQSSLNFLIQQKYQTYKQVMSRKQAVRKSIQFIQQYVVNAIQNVYQSQGINISDKHIEIIVKQMTSKVRITEVGKTGLLRDDVVYLESIESINLRLRTEPVQYEPFVFGITKASLEIEGFISAASFQETIKILTQAAILQKRDFLGGLKENLILGHLLPAGTGFSGLESIGVESESGCC